MLSLKHTFIPRVHKPKVKWYRNQHCRNPLNSSNSLLGLPTNPATQDILFMMWENRGFRPETIPLCQFSSQALYWRLRHAAGFLWILQAWRGAGHLPVSCSPFDATPKCNPSPSAAGCRGFLSLVKARSESGGGAFKITPCWKRLSKQHVKINELALEKHLASFFLWVWCGRARSDRAC